MGCPSVPPPQVSMSVHTVVDGTPPSPPAVYVTQWHPSCCFQVLERMKTIGEEPGGLKPDLHCFSAAIDAAGGVGEWESALRIIDDMRAAGIRPDGFVYR